VRIINCADLVSFLFISYSKHTHTHTHTHSLLSSPMKIPSLSTKPPVQRTKVTKHAIRARLAVIIKRVSDIDQVLVPVDKAMPEHLRTYIVKNHHKIDTNKLSDIAKKRFERYILAIKTRALLAKEQEYLQDLEIEQDAIVAGSAI
jgi:hypothetical protein